jgi:E3 ubiquitin-protein ligase HUWE1
LKDVEQDDPEYGASLSWLLHHAIDGLDLELTFSITRERLLIQDPEDISIGGQGGTTIEVPLVPNGINLDVTDSNKQTYVQLLVEWHCEGSVRDQVCALRNGFDELMPPDKVNIFTPPELELLVGGVKDISVESLQQVCVYKGGYEEYEHPLQQHGPHDPPHDPPRAPTSSTGSPNTVTFFWQILLEMTVHDRRRVLRFITGTTRVPLDGFDPCLQICRATRDDDVSKVLPSAHTCFNQLVLPEYTSKAMVKQQLLYALNESDHSFGMS